MVIILVKFLLTFNRNWDKLYKDKSTEVCEKQFLEWLSA